MRHVGENWIYLVFYRSDSGIRPFECTRKKYVQPSWLGKMLYW